MSTIYAYTSPARGHLYPLTPILSELARRGHEVRVWTMASEVERMRERGLRAESISPAIEALPLEDWQSEKASEAARRSFARWVERAPHEVADVDAALGMERPELILTDINCFGAQAAAERSGIPWATFSPYFPWLPDRGIPAYGPGLVRVSGPAGRLRDAMLWRVITGTLDRACLPTLNDLRVAIGAEPLGTLTDVWTRPGRMLVMTVEELEYPRPNMPANWRMVGPCAWDPPLPAPRWLEDVFRPLVLVTASTEFQADGELIATALEVLADEQVEVVATTAGNDPDQFTAPPNARVERFLPHGPLLQRAEVVICHGGMGITQKSLAAGVPVCVVGWGRDQLETGRRVEAANAGVLLPRKRLGPKSLRASFRKAWRRREGAEQIAAAIAASPGPAGAADELEALVRNATS